jgi:hypothetical protein
MPAAERSLMVSGQLDRAMPSLQQVFGRPAGPEKEPGFYLACPEFLTISSNRSWLTPLKSKKAFENP